MYVGWRDLLWARGRFTLVLATVSLITLLVGLLTGLTAGLGRESTSAVTSLQTDHLVLASDSFDSSRLDPARLGDNAQGLGVATVRAAGNHGATAVALIGVQTPSTLNAPARAVRPGEVVLSQAAAEDLGEGSLSIAGRDLRVSSVTGTESFAHQPVAWVDLSDWLQLTGNSQPNAATVDGPLPDLPKGWSAATPDNSLSAIPGYSSEHGSLVMIRTFLLVISALVIGAFFTVWTMQRSGDVAVLKALGATNGTVLRDALGQAAVVLTVGIGVGALVALGVGTVAEDVVPFHLPLGELLPPLLLLLALGLAGALLAVRSVLRVNPLLALNGR